MATDFGKTLWCTPATGLSTTRTATGVQTVVNRLACMLTTKRGSLPYHRDRGTNMADFLGGEVDALTLDRMANAAKNECALDGAVDADSLEVNVTETIEPTFSTVDIEVRGDCKFGPFAFVLPINKVTLEVLGIREAT